MFDRLFAISFFSSLLVVPVSAQTVWNVAPGSDVQAVIDGASPGDTLKLGLGNHTKFTLNKELTIVGPATIGFTFTPMDLVVALPPNDVARFVNVTIAPDIVLPGFGIFGNVEVQSGTVVFEGCEIEGIDAVGGSVDVQSAHAVFRHCEISAFSPRDALTAHDSNIVATDTTFTGATAGLVEMPTRGITATGSGTLHLSSCTVTGGDSVSALVPLNPSIAMSTEVDTWLADCTVRGGDGNLTPGANGMVASNAIIARCTIQGGVGTMSGVPFTGSVATDPNMLGASSTPEVIAVGLPAQVQWKGNGAGVSVAALLSSNAPRVPIRFEPLVVQPLWTLEMSFVGAIVTDVTGTATLNISVPNVQTLRYQSFALFGLAVDVDRVQVAPVVSLTVQ